MIQLGIILHALGRLGEAKKCYEHVITLESSYTKAYYQLGIILQELGRLEEAKTTYEQAIELKLDYAEAHNNLGNVLISMGKLEQAEATFKKAIAQKSNFIQAIMNLSILSDYMNHLDETIFHLETLVKIDPKNYGLRAGVHLALLKFLENDYNASEKFLLNSEKINEKVSLSYKNERIYHSYLSEVLGWHRRNYTNKNNITNGKKLYIIGDSHSLVSHNIIVKTDKEQYFGKSFLIQGCKQWHLGNISKNKYKHKFEKIFESLPKLSDVLLVFGEIDCRLDEGIIRHKKKNKNVILEELINTNLDNYLTYILNINSLCNHNIIIQGIPCPNIKPQNQDLINVIKLFNKNLQLKSRKIGFDFLNVYKLTDRGDGISNKKWHQDAYHLSQAGMIEAWLKFHNKI